ncbi:MAG: sterol desaturase family protein [Pseudomonadota bacterium]|nr:sterol desaturase family protein [Pseudomonadota bacterium]
MEYELLIRLGIFFGIFAGVAFFETRFPRRPPRHKTARWRNNLALVFLDTLILRLIFPTAAVGMAIVVEQGQWGLFNYYSLDPGLTLLLSVVALDVIIYLQHVLFHAVPLLWRLHMVHHADLEYDLTTGLRFHPIEIALSMMIKFAAIAALGVPVTAVIIFEVLLNACSMFNHGNLRLPEKIDQMVRWFIVTPDMHRVHHSSIKRETNSNYGFSLSCWDRLFGTYRAQPSLGHEAMEIGLTQFRERSRLSLPWLLILPFIGKVGSYPINRDATPNEQKPYKLHEK